MTPRLLMHEDDAVLGFSTPEQCHQAALAAYAHAKTLMGNADPGTRFRFIVGQDRDSLSARQRRFFHGVVLMQIAEQARVNGERFVMATWKEFFRKLFLQDTWEMVKLPGQKRATPRRQRVSSEDLSVKQYSEHIDKVIAYAITELGVSFDFDSHEREAVRYRDPARKAGQPEAEAVCC